MNKPVETSGSARTALDPTGVEKLVASGKVYGPLNGLYEYWKQQRGVDLMPQQGAFVGEGLLRWWSHLCVVTLEDVPQRFRIMEIGLECLRFHRSDPTGKRLDDILVAEGREWLLESYRHCARTGRPSFNVETITGRGGRPEMLTRLLLPVARGVRVSAIVSALYLRPCPRGK